VKKMKYNFLNQIKIHHYEASIQDIKAQLPKHNKKEKKIMQFIAQEYRRRINFFKALDKLEKS